MLHMQIKYYIAILILLPISVHCNVFYSTVQRVENGCVHLHLRVTFNIQSTVNGCFVTQLYSDSKVNSDPFTLIKFDPTNGQRYNLGIHGNKGEGSAGGVYYVEGGVIISSYSPFKIKRCSLNLIFISDGNEIACDRVDTSSLTGSEMPLVVTTLIDIQTVLDGTTINDIVFD